MVYAMGAPVPQSPGDLAHPDRWKPPAAPFVADVGGNVGTFLLNAAARGAVVAAFERERCHASRSTRKGGQDVGGWGYGASSRLAGPHCPGAERRAGRGLRWQA
jgi:hypothetical protein